MEEGKTPEPVRPMECMGRYRHSWQWVWKDNEMTTKQRCTTCGEVRDSAKEQTT